MKLRTILIAVLMMFSLAQTARAQTSPNVPSGSTSNPVLSQCADGKDNDADKKIDKTGRTVSGVIYPADPECLVSGAICEDGTKDCLADTSSPKTCGSGLCINIGIKNPLKVGTVQEAIKLFMDAVLRIALPFIVIAFIWSGLNFVLARGNPEKLKTAKNMFLYTIIGTLLILGAWTITNAIIGTVNTITG